MDGTQPENNPSPSSHRCYTETGNDVSSDQNEAEALQGLAKKCSPQAEAEVEDVPANEKNRVLKTLATYTCFISMGIHEAIIGPTLLHLVTLFDTDMKTISACMIVSGVAYVVGSFVGGILVDRMNQEVFFAMAECVSMTGLIIMPWGGNLYVFSAALLVSDASMAMVDSGGQSYLLNLWNGAKYKNSIIQGMQFVRAVGSMIAPFIAEPFLVPLPLTQPAGTNDTSLDSWSNNNGTNLHIPGNDLTTHSPGGRIPDIHMVAYGYLIGGFVGYIGSLLFVFAASKTFHCSSKDHRKEAGPQRKTSRKPGSPLKATKQDKIYRVVIFSLFFLSFMSYQWIESIPGFFVAAFVVAGQGWDIAMGSLITSVFWGSHTFGLLLGIPLARVLAPRKMLVISLSVTTVSVVTLTLFAGRHPTVTWATIAMAGVGMSTIFGSLLVLASSYVKVDGLAAAVFLFGSSVGYMTCYPLTGYLFQTFSHMWMAYLAIISCGVSVALLIGLGIFHAAFPHHRPQAHAPDQAVEMESMKPDVQTDNCVQVA